MKCKKCKNKAITYLKPYRIALCENCYVKFYESLVKRCIKRYGILKRDEKILVAVSGGKDSSAMAYVLKTLNYNIELFYIDLGIKNYSKASEKAVNELAEFIDANLNIVRLKDYGFTISDVEMSKVCSACGTSKRYLMNRFARENGFDIIATGHTAEDIVTFYIKNMASGSKIWAEKLMPRNEGFDKLVARAKPLYEISEKENMLYVLCKDIPFTFDECPFAPNPDWKEIVYEIERRKPGFVKNFVRGIVKEESPQKLMHCEICGEVSSTKICAFCRLRKRYGNL